MRYSKTKVPKKAANDFEKSTGASGGHRHTTRDARRSIECGNHTIGLERLAKELGVPFIRET